jgi:sulfate-transporting ATPase
VNWILELDRGRYFPYEGNYSTYLEKKAKRLEQEAREDAGRQKRSRTSWSGSGNRPRLARPNPRRVSKALSNWSKQPKTAQSARHRLSSRTPNALAAR